MCLFFEDFQPKMFSLKLLIVIHSKKQEKNYLTKAIFTISPEKKSFQTADDKFGFIRIIILFQFLFRFNRLM